MLAANLPVCQYTGMPGQNNTSTQSVSCNNNTNSFNNNSCNNNGESNPNSNGGNSNSNSGLVGGGTSAVAAKNQLEQLNTMREALFSQDGWGCQHVNQDTNWEVPNSPEPTNKDPSGGPTLWKPTINNGTDLWESNLRNGGQPSTQHVPKTPWGHTPSSNLGGTWGEDDDGTDSSSVWTGSSANAPTAGNVGVTGIGAGGIGSSGGPNSGPQWGQSSVGVGSGGGNAGTPVNIAGVAAGGAPSSAVVNIPNSSTGSTGVASGNGWGDPRELRSGQMGGPVDMRGVDPRDPMRAASAGDPRDLRMVDPRDPIRGDPRGISGRLNGNSEMWSQHHPITHNQMPTINKMVGQGVSGPSVSGAVATSGGVSIGPGGISGINTASVGASNVGAQWGSAQAIVGPKDITLMAGKQPSGWEEPSPPPQRRHIPNYDDGTSLWGQQSRVPGGASHWKDISDPMSRSHLIRNAVGSQNSPNAGVVSGLGGVSGNGLGSGQGGCGIGTPGSVGVSGNPNNSMGSVGPQGRLTSTVVGPNVGITGQHKPENALWTHQSGGGVSNRNTASWGDDSNHNMGTSAGPSWVDDKSNVSIGQLTASVGGTSSWNDSAVTWNKNQSKISTNAGSSWSVSGASEGHDISSDWSTHGGIVGKSHQKLGGASVGVGLNIEMIKQSKQYRILIDTGFKKDEVERALLSANMNIEEAAEMLRTNAVIVMDGWRRHEEALCSYPDHSNSSSGSFSGRYPTAGTQPIVSFPPNNLLSNMGGSTVSAGGNGPNLAVLNVMQPLQAQKYLNQGSHNLSAGPQSVNTSAVAFGQGANITATPVNATSSSNNQPSAQQLRMLVQQIQLAVHSGYLSSQILNQPLAPATLLLLNQLLSNIKHLQGAQQSLARGNNANNLQINVAISKYKQHIQNLQNQINAQQAIYIKQQQQQSLQQNPQHLSAHVSSSNTDYLRGQHDAISAMQNNFSEINLNKPSGYQSVPNQQSRLTQWKLPVLEKDVTSDSTDFSRAPGATKQSTSANNASNVGPLGLQNDGTWSTGRNIGDGWPDPSNENENKDWSVAQPTNATAYTDLVQEFEPGKPWKGSQIKTIEDDPSITPGSVARSPLSINPTPKDADIFANASKNSPTDLPPLSLSSSTWSFNPSSSNQNFSSWSDNPQQCATSELWANPMNKTSRGPPPGLGSNKSVGVTATSVINASSVVSGNSNGWLVGGGRAVPNVTSWSGTTSSWNSNWLLVKNLTAQIDGSTLRTLCMQHGPLITFHLYLNQGIALCKYATREEANKAQMTLNNCVLGNTTICAESPNENEVQSILQRLPLSSNTAGTPGTSGKTSGNGGSGSAGSGSGGITNGKVGNNGGSGSSHGGDSGNSSVSGNSVVNGAGNNAGNNTTSGGCASSTAQSQTGAAGCSSNNAGYGVNTAGSNNGSVGNVNNSNNATWRQAQNQQNQARPSGREADFDYISKFVCSIVDD